MATVTYSHFPQTDGGGGDFTAPPMTIGSCSAIVPVSDYTWTGIITEEGMFLAMANLTSCKDQTQSKVPELHHNWQSDTKGRTRFWGSGQGTMPSDGRPTKHTSPLCMCMYALTLWEKAAGCNSSLRLLQGPWNNFLFILGADGQAFLLAVGLVLGCGSQQMPYDANPQCQPWQTDEQTSLGLSHLLLCWGKRKEGVFFGHQVQLFWESWDQHFKKAHWTGSIAGKRTVCDWV